MLEAPDDLVLEQEDESPVLDETGLPTALLDREEEETLAEESAAEPESEPGAAGRRRRRRGRRGRGLSETRAPEPEPEDGGPRAITNGVVPHDVPLDDERYVPEVPPSSHLAEMVQSGGLVLPERRRRRRSGRGGGESDVAAEAPTTTGVAPTATPAARGARDRLSPIEEMIARQNVLFDQLLQRQTAMLKAMERLMTVVERRGVGGGAAGGAQTAMQRVGVFVDVPNIVYAAERIGVQIDWGKVLNWLTRDRQLVRATAYAPVSDDAYQRIETQKFVQPFYSLPYRILTKPLKRFGNGEIKANFDVELAIDAITLADRLDVICLVSGDGDFRRMVEIVQAKGVRVEVIAFGTSTAGELRTVCDDYVDIGQHLLEFSVTR